MRSAGRRHIPKIAYPAIPEPALISIHLDPVLFYLVRVNLLTLTSFAISICFKPAFFNSET